MRGTRNAQLSVQGNLIPNRLRRLPLGLRKIQTVASLPAIPRNKQYVTCYSHSLLCLFLLLSLSASLCGCRRVHEGLGKVRLELDGGEMLDA